MKDLTGHTALVTGAGGGLGGAIARALAAEGVHLVLSDLPSADLTERAEQLRATGVQVECVAADLAVTAEAAALVGKAESALAPIDILVNNAGTEFVGSFAQRTPHNLELQASVNLLAPMLLTHAVLPGMIERGRGNVVSISSVAGKFALPYDPGYCATKYGIAAFMRSLSIEYGSSPVAFSSIHPGAIRDAGMGTSLFANAPAIVERLMTRSPEQVGAAVVKAVRDDRVEVLVSAQPVRFPALLNAVAPEAAVRSMRMLKPLSGRLLAGFNRR